MPQLKKVVLVVGERLIYADTYDQALAELSGAVAGASRRKQRKRNERAGINRDNHHAGGRRSARREHSKSLAAL
jgi:uncharacterized membrane protein (UPF0182 family)